jgi:dihydrofolate synthase/folylpolyglutamate synthase
LGDTLEKIAGEKAGIIKRGVPVVVSERQAEVEQVFVAKSSQMEAAIHFASDIYHVKQRNVRGRLVFDVFRKLQLIMKDVELPLQGFYQIKNIPGVLRAVDLLRELNWQISDTQVLHGLLHVVSQTGLKGRWQVLSEHPLKICDTAHNPDGIKEIVGQLKALAYDTLHMVIGMVKDKDISAILQLLPQRANYYFCQANIPRAMDALLLAEKAAAHGLRGCVIRDVNQAIKEAERNANENDMIFIGGSTFVVAEIDNL